MSGASRIAMVQCSATEHLNWKRGLIVEEIELLSKESSCSFVELLFSTYLNMIIIL